MKNQLLSAPPLEDENLQDGFSPEMISLLPSFLTDKIPVFNQPGWRVLSQVPAAGSQNSVPGRMNPPAGPESSSLDAVRPEKRKRINPPQTHPSTARATNTTARAPTSVNQAATSINNHTSRASGQGLQLTAAPVFPTLAMDPMEARANETPTNKVPLIKPEPRPSPKIPINHRAKPTRGAGWHLAPADIDRSVLLQPRPANYINTPADVVSGQPPLPRNNHQQRSSATTNVQTAVFVWTLQVDGFDFTVDESTDPPMFSAANTPRSQGMITWSADTNPKTYMRIPFGNSFKFMPIDEYVTKPEVSRRARNNAA